MKKVIFVLASIVLLSACAHNVAVHGTGLVVNQAGLYLGTGTVAVIKGNTTVKSELGVKNKTDSGFANTFLIRTDTQLNGYDVEFEKVKHAQDSKL